MQYYRDQVTTASWQELQILKKELNFILIGGWATYLYTQSLKSKDIDIIINYDQLVYLEKRYQLTKNDRLYKYEARHDPIQIDIYLPYYSQLGIEVGKLLDKTTQVLGFTVLQKEWLIALKIYTLKQRGRTHKGRKDFYDLVSLWQSGFEQKQLKTIIQDSQIKTEFKFFLEYADEFKNIPELKLNNHHYAKVKRKIKASC